MDKPKAHVIEDKLLGIFEVKVGNGDHPFTSAHTVGRAISLARIMANCKENEIAVHFDRVKVTTDTDLDGDMWNWKKVGR